MSGGIHPQLQSRSVDNWESGCLMPETTEVDKIDQACEQIETLSLEDEEKSADDEETCDSINEQDEEISFDSEICIFCNYRSVDFDGNLEHMSKAHGFSIPNEEQLFVYAEALIKYLHLVIFGYNECLHCGSRRNTTQGVQQHMTGRRHCKINIDNYDSEFRDFYDLESSSGETEIYVNANHKANDFLAGDDKTLRLASGKILSHRSMKPPRLHRHNETGASSKSAPPHQIANRKEDTTSTGDQLAEQEPSLKSKRLIKREATLLNQLSTLRATDRNSLAHLPVWKQRALVERSMKETEHARREENTMKLKIQLKANKTAKK